MDGLSVAANIISIVTAGVRSAVVIREILNGIKDGPAHVRELGIKVDEVSGLLKQLKVLQQHVSGNELDELSTMTQRCAAELETFEGKISKLRNVPGDRRWAKVRKGLKTILKEDDFLSMSRRLSHYIGVFGVQLGVLGALKNLEGNAQLAHLHDDVSGLRDQSALVSASKKLKDFKDATIIELKNSNSTLHQHTVVLQSIEGNLTGMREDASNHKGLIQSQHQDALRVFKGVEAKMDHMVNMSTGQSNAIIGLLEQLIAVRSTPTNHLSTISLPSAGGEGVAGRELAVRKDSDDEFSQSINRLCSLVGMKRTTINSSEAEVIINDLEKILDTVSRLPDLTSRKRLRHGEYDRDEGSREDSRDIKKMKKMITSSPPIELDQKVVRMPNHASLLRQSFRLKMCEAGDTTLSIFLRNRRRWDETVDYSTSQSDETIQEVFVGTLTVLPPDATCQGSARYRIMASFQQHVYDRGYTFLTPSISFYSVIPESSEIFTIAEKGDLDGLVRLLASGKGSLRDIDAVGRTLLHYACTGMQPQMCKFLLENGADPNALAGPFDEVELGPLIYGNPNPDIINEFIEQERILLDAGADPLLGLYTQWNYLTYALRIGGLDLLKLILSYSGTFFHLEEILDECGNTPLLYAAGDVDLLRGARKVGELVARGANVKAANKHGNTLLHIILGSSPIWSGLIEGAEKTTSYISLFIKVGVNVSAVNSAGETPSHIAYRFGRGEYWERSLFENGYDAASICGVQYQIRPSPETVLNYWEGRCEVCGQYLSTTDS